MPDQKRKEFQILVDKFLNGTANAEEQETLDRYYLLFRDEPEYANRLNQEQLQRLEERIENGLFNRIHQPAKTKRLWPRIAAAASVLLMLSAGGYFIWHKNHNVTDTLVKNDIAPGHNQATLTLANGQKIVITKNLKGQIAVQAGTVIQADNAIAYDSKNNESVSYNTLATARGEQSPYPLVLADGSKVWLNAASSITFPTAFNGKERVVKITGEAYFEVKHNEKQPFKVEANDQTIEDIGTAFDVNAYSDETATKTTLVEGSVKVNKLILKPGEQTDGINKTTVNTAQFTAWKDGDFNFDDDKITTVMRQLSRWYNIDIKYQGKLTGEGFHVISSRQRNISSVLRMLEKTKGVHFKIEGKEVTVIQ